MHQNHTVFIAHHRLMMYAVAVSFNLKKKKGLKLELEACKCILYTTIWSGS